MEIKIENTLITLAKGDITTEATDAIVNAANTKLAGGGGVDGAIHRGGGPEIMAECRKIGGCRTGDAVITTGGRLPARFVIHTVGPVYSGGSKGEASLLSSAYLSSLKLAEEKGLKTITFPSISTGVYGYPIEEASVVALVTVIEFIKRGTGITMVKFVLFSHPDLATYGETLKKLATHD